MATIRIRNSKYQVLVRMDGTSTSKTFTKKTHAQKWAKSTSYSEGTKQIQCNEFFDDGTMNPQANYENNIENGMRKHFDQEGNLSKIRPVVNASLHGYWRIL